MMEVGKDQRLHPENLTPAQEKLADLLIETKTVAKVRRRRQLPLGGFEFFEVERPTSPFDFAKTPEEFAFKLHEENPSVPLSPNKIILRNLPENVLDWIGAILAKAPIKDKPDFCTGIPEAGVALAQAYSRYSNIPFEEVFTKIQTEKGRRIVALEKSGKAIGENKKLLVIDDVVTKALSFLEAAAALKTVPYSIVHFLVVVDREEGGAMELAKRGYNFSAAFKLSQLLDYYLRTGKINKEQYDLSKAYLAASQ